MIKVSKNDFCLKNSCESHFVFKFVDYGKKIYGKCFQCIIFFMNQKTFLEFSNYFEH